MVTKKKVVTKKSIKQQGKSSKKNIADLDNFIKNSGEIADKEIQRIAGLEDNRKEASFKKAKREKAIRTNEALPYTVEMINNEVDDFIRMKNTPPYAMEMGQNPYMYKQRELPEIDSEEYKRYSKGQKAAYAYLKSIDSEILTKSKQYENMTSKMVGNFDGNKVATSPSYKEWLLKQIDDHMIWVRKQLES